MEAFSEWLASMQQLAEKIHEEEQEKGAAMDEESMRLKQEQLNEQKRAAEERRAEIQGTLSALLGKLTN
jgi:hypothetical protein